MRLIGLAAAGSLLVSVVLVGTGIRLAALGLGWTPNGPEAGMSGEARARYGDLGPHAIGVRAVSIGPSTLAGMLWYPAHSSGAGAGSATYSYGLKAFGQTAFVLATYGGVGVLDAEADAAGGPYPLVLLSPGFAFGATTYGWLAEHLASHGFVVLALEHVEGLDPSLLWRATVERPRDIVMALDAMDRGLPDAGGSDAGGALVDVGHVAVIGHSYGGYTALAAAGARLDSTGLRRTCNAVPPDDRIAFQCDALIPHLDALANAAGLDSPPDGLWPSWGDGRVDAAVALAGDAVMFGSAGAAEVEVPVLAIGGTADPDAPFAWGTQLAYEAVSSPRKVEVGLEGAAHMVFTGPCETSRRVLTVLRQPFCADPAWDKAMAHALVRHYVTAFLRAELTGDADAAQALRPGSTPFQGVRYAATGY